MPLRVMDMKEDKKGLVFDIQGFSVHDGPGSRTTVFLSGCPLRCRWCANPEGWELSARLLFSDRKCVCEKSGCRRCEAACPRGGIHIQDGRPRRDPSVCGTCTGFECAKACYHEALRLSGEWYSVEELMEVLRRDRQFWTSGGVTFSGGDPMVQKEFLLEVLKRCKKEAIHTAVETSAHGAAEDFLELLSYINLAFIDVKHMDSKSHKRGTGLGNELILNNISRLCASGWNGRLILRIPVIPGYNDDAENMREVIHFMKMNGLFEINLLPFHRMGATKWTQLGLKYPYSHQPAGETEKLKELQSLFLFCDIACYIGGEIIY